MAWKELRRAVVVVLCGTGFVSACLPGLPQEKKRKISISGVVQAMAGNIADSDTNDPNADYQSNDTSDTAQAVHSTATIGGFVSGVGTGREGDRFAASKDEVDTFRVTLVKGQSVSLSISDFIKERPSLVDLDLYLYLPQAVTPLASSECDVIDTEQLVAPETGDYDVVVVAYGASISNYVLTLGAATGVSCPGLAVQYDFVPGEALVQFKSPSRAGIASAKSPSDSGISGLRTKQVQPGNLALLSLPITPERTRILQTLGVRKINALRRGLAGADPVIQRKLETIQMIKALRARDDVLTADLNYIRQPLLAPDDPHYSLQWNYPLINLPQAWDITTGSANVIVAVVDTGVNMTHPDLTANLLTSGYDFISDPISADDGDGIDNNPDDPGDRSDGGFGSYHGTHVAGTIAAVSDNAVGVSGIAWNSKIMPLRVSGLFGASDFDIIQAVRYAAGLSNVSHTVPAQKADIINISLGGGGRSTALQQAFSEVDAAGVIVVAAAGNGGIEENNYPAAYDTVISVGAVGPDKGYAIYSSFGSTIDVAAPGGDQRLDSRDGVLSTAVDDRAGIQKATYAYYQGTSMAVPHVAGVLALMKAVFPGLTPALVLNELRAGKLTELMPMGGLVAHDAHLGYGVIDAYKAVQHAQCFAVAACTESPVLGVAAKRLEFSADVSSLNVTAMNLGAGELVISNVAVEDSWLSIAPVTLDASGLGSYQVTVDRNNLPDFLYRSNLVFTTNVSMVKVPVVMLTGTDTTVGDTSALYILLLDAKTSDTIAEVQSVASNGEYAFKFDKVPDAEFYIKAGTDMDNDQDVCDRGEACGAFPNMTDVDVVVPSGKSVAGISFRVGFREEFGLAGGSSRRNGTGQMQGIKQISR